MGVDEIHSKSEFETLINSCKNVILFCFAEWSGPCKAIYPFFEKHAAEYEEHSDSMKFVKVDTDEVPEFEELGIRSVPTFYAFKDGEKVDNLEGANPPALKHLVDSAAGRLE